MLAGFLIEMIIIVQLALCEEDTVVYSPAGAVRGWERLSRDGRLYTAWTKIPYAQPPVGKLRFKPPKPAIPWRGVLNATEDSPHCLQIDDTTSTEDCLYLSIYRPQLTRRKMPVVAYIHGGGFSVGHSNARNQADYVMDEDLVLVVAHFRLNMFGFASLGDDVLPGNFGLKDLALVLRWIQSNIESFGGDPKSVTLAGTSTGAAASQILARSPATKDIVARSFLDSGSISHGLGLVQSDRLTNWTIRSARAVGCDRDTNRAILICLQRANSSELLATFQQYTNMEPLGISNFGPVIEPPTAEDAVITEDLTLRSSTKPAILSFTNGELSIYIDIFSAHQAELEQFRQNLTKYLKRLLRSAVNSSVENKAIDEGVKILKNQYFSTNESVNNITVFTRNRAMMYADCLIYYSSLYAMKHHQGPKWMSHFEHRGELSGLIHQRNGNFFSKAVAHSDMTHNLLNVRSLVPNAGPEQSQADYAVSKRWIKYLTNFATHSDPNPTGSKTWKQFSDWNIFRITSQGDQMGDREFSSTFQDKFELWYNLIGWG